MAVDRTKENPADNKPVNDIELSEQEILNKSFDKDYNVLATEMLVLGDDDRLKRQEKIATETTLQAVLKASGGSSYKIVAGPLEDTGYLYIGYKDGDAWMIKRQNLTTTAWGYAYGESGFNWANRSSLTYGDPQ